MFCLRHLEKYRENNTNVRMSLMGEVKCRPVDWTYLLRGMRTPAQLSRTWRGTRLFTMSSLVTPVPCTIFACLVRCKLRKKTRLEYAHVADLQPVLTPIETDQQRALIELPNDAVVAAVATKVSPTVVGRQSRETTRRAAPLTFSRPVNGTGCSLIHG